MVVFLLLVILALLLFGVEGTIDVAILGIAGCAVLVAVVLWQHALMVAAGVVALGWLAVHIWREYELDRRFPKYRGRKAGAPIIVPPGPRVPWLSPPEVDSVPSTPADLR